MTVSELTESELTVFVLYFINCFDKYSFVSSSYVMSVICFAVIVPNSVSLLNCWDGVKFVGFITSYATKSKSLIISVSFGVNFFLFTIPETKLRELLYPNLSR